MALKPCEPDSVMGEFLAFVVPPSPPTPLHPRRGGKGGKQPHLGVSLAQRRTRRRASDRVQAGTKRNVQSIRSGLSSGQTVGTSSLKTRDQIWLLAPLSAPTGVERGGGDRGGMEPEKSHPRRGNPNAIRINSTLTPINLVKLQSSSWHQTERSIVVRSTMNKP